MAVCGRASAEFLRVPEADLTVVVIANLASIVPLARLPRAIATLALEGHKKLKPAPAQITQAELKPLAGTWFNAEEPSRCSSWPGPTAKRW